MTVYTIHMAKSWLFSIGHELFHFFGLEVEGVFGKQEVFHPRLRAVAPATKYNKNLIEFLESLSFSKSEIRRTAMSLCIPSDWITIDSSSEPQESSTLTSLQKDCIRMMHFVQHATKVLGQARVISFQGQLVDSESYPQELKNILDNQKQLLTLLEEPT